MHRKRSRRRGGIFNTSSTTYGLCRSLRVSAYGALTADMLHDAMNRVIRRDAVMAFQDAMLYGTGYARIMAGGANEGNT